MGLYDQIGTKFIGKLFSHATDGKRYVFRKRCVDHRRLTSLQIGAVVPPLAKNGRFYLYSQMILKHHIRYTSSSNMELQHAVNILESGLGHRQLHNASSK